MPNVETALPKPCAIWWCVAYRKEGSQYCTVHHAHEGLRTMRAPSGTLEPGTRLVSYDDGQITR